MHFGKNRKKMKFLDFYFDKNTVVISVSIVSSFIEQLYMKWQIVNRMGATTHVQVKRLKICSNIYYTESVIILVNL